MKIVWTRHAEERQRQWQKRLGITRRDAENVLKNPEQIVPGDLEVSVAQSRRGKGLLRVLFIEAKGERKILTLYWTSKANKYWKED